MLFVTFCAILCSIYADQLHKLQRRREIIEKIRSHGGVVNVYPSNSLLKYIYGKDLVYEFDSLGWRGATDENLSLVGQLPEIKTLRLSEPHISDWGMRKLSPLVNLETLYLFHSSITNDSMEIIGHFAKLRVLSLLYNKKISDEGLLQLNQLANLENVNLTKCGITGKGLSVFENAHCLDTLYLDGNPITDDSLSSISKAPKLRCLLLNFTPVSDAGLKHLSQSDSIQLLGLVHTKINGSGIENLSKMKSLITLDLSSCNLKEDCLIHCEKLSSVKFIDVSKNPLSDSFIFELDSNLPNTIVYTRYPNKALPLKRIAYDDGYILRNGSDLTWTGSHILQNAYGLLGFDELPDY